MDIEAKLQELGLTLPEAPKPVAAYVPFVQTGNLIVISGQLPFKDRHLVATGKVASKVQQSLARSAARQCFLNALSVLGDAIDGDWNRLTRIVRLGIFVQSDDDFYDQPKVANGASELCQELFGDAGKHARAAVGVNVLPLNATVELELTAEVSS